ncbi:bifunctional metallophosphatase/5'-nucleotidase [Paenibacillus hamazuiensis]|uniref:bifunctional metallophosphatase/5'-nucleotidase n=1 Tax=Paenibacillus hamazuiensis TaxID=2936508 RepID=UPI00200C1BAC|nr:5'-nucleotidase C-terminal domain-containing protein [Paenibacillus hamazuiensis]
MMKIRLTVLAGLTASTLFAGSALAAPVKPVSHADWMQKKTFIEGEGSGNLALERNLTVAEAVTVIARVKGEKNLKADASASHWAAGALAWASKNGIITDAEAKAPNQAPTASRITEMASKAGYSLSLPEKDAVTRAEFFNALGDAITLHITIGHTNDVHGHIEENTGNKEFGYAKIATLIKQWREENPNFMLMDAGDTFQGTVFVNLFKGESIVPILNSLEYNAMAAGNHEFDFGYEQLLKLKGMLKYPVINANVFKEDGTELLTPVYYAEVGGQKFAFIGFVTDETPILTHPDNVKGLTFKKPVEIAKKLVPELKKQVDHVVVVSHVGIETDREIAKNVPGIDFIVGGHSHTPIRTPENVNGTYIVQDWEYGKSLGRADLYYLGKELVNFTGGLVEYDEKVAADPEVAEMVKKVTGQIDEALNVVIAKAEVPLDGDRSIVRKRESNLGNFIADAMLERSKSFKGYEADVALTNGGGIRTQINQGDITKKALYDVLPFPNTLVVLEATGAEIQAALENGVSQVENGAGRFPQIGGMSFTYNPDKPAGERVIEVKVGGKPIDPAKTYRLVTNDFIASGGDGYSMFTNKKAMNSGVTLYELVEEAFIKQKTINAAVDGRIQEVK